MAERQSTPDILGGLMSGMAIKQESNNSIEQEANKAIEPATHKARKQESKKAVFEQLEIKGVPKVDEEPKEKATFNLPIRVLEELDAKWMEIRKISGSKQISRTLIVEKALEMAFSEFDQKKQLGKFYSKLASNKTIKQ